MAIRVEGVHKRFGTYQALEDINVNIEDGSLVALLGPSGSGKSTLLRMIAGLETPDTGRIYLTGEDATNRPVQDRGVGFVFQHYALFKHLTVRDNIGFGLALRKQSKAEIKRRTDELLDLIQLAGLGDRYPSQLSGGQRQRVALARALAIQPRILLLDEPFGALDAKVRKDLRAWLRRLHEEVRVTTVFVTHDQEEAMEVAHQLVVMNQGRIEQVGTADEIYDNPASSFVMSFIGPVNVLPVNAGISLSNENGQPERIDHHDRSAQIYLRPQDIQIELSPSSDAIPVTVERIIHLGWEIQLELRLSIEREIRATLNRETFDALCLRPSQTVYLRPKHIRVFSSNGSNVV
jgi:sulfate transport system ATP-binding protein